MNRILSNGWVQGMAKVIFLLSFIFKMDSIEASVFHEKNETIISINKNGQSPHAEHNVSITAVPDKYGFFRLHVNGKGNYAGFKNVVWISQAEIFIKDRSLYISHSTTDVFNNGVKVFESLKNFDHISKIVSLRIKDEKGIVVKNKQYPIKGPICDDVTLIHVLAYFASEVGLKNLKHFYLLTNEPKLYHVMVKYRGREILDLSGREKADKFQLMADLGPLTEVAAKVVPPTFVWYRTESHADWLQYEGMESGYKSTNIRSYVVKK